MRLLIAIIVSLVFSTVAQSQTFKGKVYDSKSVVKDIKVVNKSQNILAVTDKEGNFNIAAKVNDTISFQSIFYYPLEVIVISSFFDQENIFQVKKITNELDEVNVISVRENKFDSISYYTTIDTEKQKLSKKPLLKSGDNLMPTLDLKQLFKGIAKLFRRKNNESTNQLPLDYKQLEAFFSSDDFFNKTLITRDLKIPDDKAMMFLDFCSTKGLNPRLLKEENKMEFLEELVVNSELFLILLEQYGDEKTIKD